MQGANSNHYNFAIIPCNSLENCVVGVGMTKKQASYSTRSNFHGAALRWDDTEANK